MAEAHLITAKMIIEGYRHGRFVMAQGRQGGIGWYHPDPRAILPLRAFHISTSLRKRVCRRDYQITCDTVFKKVIEACAAPRRHNADTWINQEIITLYTQLHELGLAHSFEAWRQIEESDRNVQPYELVGGLYGVALGGAFFGESMFSHATDASKVCLVELVERLNRNGFTLLDVQFASPHLNQFGVIEISRSRYMQMLAEALPLVRQW